jgi:alpha-L-rhamnosidase
VGYDALRTIEHAEAPLEGARWIWAPGEDAKKAPRGVRGFFKEIDVPGEQVLAAAITISADDKYALYVNGDHVGMSNGSGDTWRLVKKIDLRPYLKPGKNVIGVRVENTDETYAGLVAKLTVRTNQNPTRETVVVTDGAWKATSDPIGDWNKAGPTDAMPAAVVVAAYGDEPWGRLRLAAGTLPPAAYLRGAFNVGKPVKSATLYAAALGTFEARLNGERVHNDVFPSGWTDYTKRVYYRAYDVTGRVKPGENVLGAVLADGWYSSHIGWYFGRDHYGKNPRFAAQLHLEFADGTSQEVVTDGSWRAATAGGPVREADLLAGEAYDARKEIPGWDRPGNVGAEWAAVATGAEVQPRVQWHMGPPVIAIKEFPAKKVQEPRPGVYVFDLGQNIAGVARLKLRNAPAGTPITLRFAERLNPDGTLYTVNLRTARVTDYYFARGGGGGGGEETWTPQFTFHGFQYVEVTGLPAGRRPPLDTVTGVFVGSDTPDAGSFASSDPMLNQLHSNIYWTQRANFLDVPTDCPQRDERLGWTGDAQIYVKTATLNCDVQAFFDKWLIDLADSQRPDGQFPQVAPLKVAGSDGGPAWSDAGAIVPWTIYEVYGDKRVLARQYDSMKRYVEFNRKRSTAEFLPPGGPTTRSGRGPENPYHAFGDWLSIEAPTPNDIIYMAYWYHSTVLTAKTADVLGKADEAATYRTLASNIKDAFNRTYVAEDGRIRGNTQACYVLALAYDLVDGPRREAAARYLVEDIEKRGNHLSTGFIGTKDLMLALSKIGREDVAYRLLHQETFPGWGFSIKQGATSIWERWDGWTPEKGFQDPGMNSFAHYSFGAVYQWMVENIGGIRGDGIAYERVVIEPQVEGSGLSGADVGYRSIRGQIRSRWMKKGAGWTLEVTVPANVTATVRLPAGEVGAVRESGRALANAPGVHGAAVREGRVAVEIGSGHYVFKVARGGGQPQAAVSQER